LKLAVFDHDKVGQGYGKQHSPNDCAFTTVEIPQFVLPHPPKRVRYSIENRYLEGKLS